MWHSGTNVEPGSVSNMKSPKKNAGHVWSRSRIREMSPDPGSGWSNRWRFRFILWIWIWSLLFNNLLFVWNAALIKVNKSSEEEESGFGDRIFPFSRTLRPFWTSWLVCDSCCPLQIYLPLRCLSLVHLTDNPGTIFACVSLSCECFQAPLWQQEKQEQLQSRVLQVRSFKTTTRFMFLKWFASVFSSSSRFCHFLSQLTTVLCVVHFCLH